MCGLIEGWRTFSQHMEHGPGGRCEGVLICVVNENRDLWIPWGKNSVLSKDCISEKWLADGLPKLVDLRSFRRLFWVRLSDFSKNMNCRLKRQFFVVTFYGIRSLVEVVGIYTQLFWDSLLSMLSRRLRQIVATGYFRWHVTGIFFSFFWSHFCWPTTAQENHCYDNIRANYK
jgi:hypothetical protein